MTHAWKFRGSGLKEEKKKLCAFSTFSMLSLKYDTDLGAKVVIAVVCRHSMSQIEAPVRCEVKFFYVLFVIIVLEISCSGIPRRVLLKNHFEIFCSSLPPPSQYESIFLNFCYALYRIFFGGKKALRKNICDQCLQ